MGTFLLSKRSLNVITVKLFLYSKNRFLKNLCSGIQCGGFQFLLILDLWGISFHAVIVFGLGRTFYLNLFQDTVNRQTGPRHSKANSPTIFAGKIYFMVRHIRVLMKSKATNNSFFHLCAFHEFLSHMHDSTLKALLQEKKH